MNEVDVEVEAEAWLAAMPDAEFSAIAAAERALGMAQKHGGVTVLLADDAEVRALNARFRGKDAATNVLSFPSPANPEEHLGDVALAFETCKREAAEQGKPLSDHLQHLVAHGVLHLVGYDHEIDADAEVMEALERRILESLGVADPYA
jgi:probable rRNA maturation factor